MALLAGLLGAGSPAGAAPGQRTPTASAAPTPTATPALPPGPSPYKLPWPGGLSLECVQGNNGSFSHRGLEAYAWDFAMPTGSVVLAARSGVVRFVSQDNNLGGTNWSAYASKGNYVVIDHGDGTSGLYLHLMYHGVLVAVGDRVAQGQAIAYSGATGFASGPHLHFMVEKTDPNSPFSQSLPEHFADVATDRGVPKEGDDYTSGNATSAITRAPTIVELSNRKAPTPTTSDGTTASGGADSVALAVAFARDLTLPDGSGVYAGQTFTKAWQVRNSGSDTWPAGTHLVPEGESALDVVSTAAVDQVAPGAVADLGVTLRAPLEAAGSAEQQVWRLADAGGTPFGDVLWLRVQVGAPLPTLPLAAAPQDHAAAYFAPTGHSVGWPFLGFYRTHGGLDIFGYPRTEAIHEDGMTIQYFQRARFEYHPDLPAGQQVQLTLLGDELTTDQRPFPTSAPFASSAQHRYFPETQHSVSFGFLHYFERHGGLAVFGYPTSEELSVVGPHGPTTIQYFQRARFEYHPEFAGTPYEVELGLLGDQFLAGRGWLPLPPGSAAAAPAAGAAASTGIPGDTADAVAAKAAAAATATPTAASATPAATPGAGAPGAGHTATVTAAELRVHSGPAGDATVVGYLAKGDRVDVLATRDGWAQVRGNRIQGWVSTAYLAA